MMSESKHFSIMRLIAGALSTEDWSQLQNVLLEKDDGQDGERPRETAMDAKIRARSTRRARDVASFTSMFPDATLPGHA